MTSRIVHAFRELPDVRTHPGVDPLALDQLEASHELVLPPDHREVLRWSNGLEVYGGYYRLFGVGPGAGIDSVVWNEYAHWKFAWRDRCSEYWCFAETAWGDQYAYEIRSLRARGTAEVRFLDALSMTPEVISGSFIDFLDTELLRLAREPYDHVVPLARARFGPLDIASHLVYVPSLLLGGTEAIENVKTMNARAAMVCNGDIATQLDEGPSNGEIKGIEPYEDGQGRMRVRVLWS